MRFSQLNILNESKVLFLKVLDVIYCCNVLIFFDGLTRCRIVQHFCHNLRPGGYLFLGRNESLRQFNNYFRLVYFAGTTAYGKSPRDGS